MDNSSEHSTCQSNDSEGSCGNTSEHSFETESESASEPSEMSKSSMEVTNEKKCEACSKIKEVNLVFVSLHIKTPSLSHLIKDCDYYEKKMAREAEVKRVVNTDQYNFNAGRPKLNSVMPNINTGTSTEEHCRRGNLIVDAQGT
ncbi:hypothetical protein Tco_0472940 [Tanacetum coccineum]